ncbi:MAG: NAD(P)-dependent oxidoreductase [Planctomycetota bacterium]
MRIAVTGAAGFIGHQLIDHLVLSGHDVTALLHRAQTNFSHRQGIRTVVGDITKPETLAGKFSGCDLVVHLAGCTIARTGTEFDRVNRGGTRAVAQECAAQANPPTLLFVSSLAAAGPAATLGRTEADPPCPVSDYGHSKRAAEKELHSFADQLPIRVVRPPSVFGATDRFMLSLFKTAKSGWVFLPGRESAAYSLIHVQDLVAAITRVATATDQPYLRPNCRDDDLRGPSQANPGVVFLAQDPPMTFPEIATIVREVTGGKRVRVISVPKSVCWAIAATNSGLTRLLGVKPLLNCDKMREAMAGNWTCDNHRLCQQYGFEFQVSLEERIRQTAWGYREKGWI